MTDDIKKTIAEVDRVLAHPLQNRDWRGIVRLLRDALEAERQQAEEWRVLWEKAANGVLALQAERDALRTVVRETLESEATTHRILTGREPDERDSSATWRILSRAIDTKEKP